MEPNEELGKVLLQGTFRLEPLQRRVKELTDQRKLSQVCKQIGVTRNQVYLILSGKSNTEERTLRSIVEGMELCWDDVVNVPSAA